MLKPVAGWVSRLKSVPRHCSVSVALERMKLAVKSVPYDEIVIRNEEHVGERVVMPP